MIVRIYRKKGAPINTDFNNYHIYTAIDMPEIVTKFVNTHEPTGPYGAKAVAEIPINGPSLRSCQCRKNDAYGLHY